MLREALCCFLILAAKQSTEAADALFADVESVKKRGMSRVDGGRDAIRVDFVGVSAIGYGRHHAGSGAIL